MTSKYGNLKKQIGEDGARDYMRSLRSKVKTVGLANVDPARRVEIARNAATARWQKHNNENSPEKDPTSAR